MFRKLPTIHSDCLCTKLIGGPRGSVGIAIDYGLEGPGSNPGGDEIFQTGPGGPPSLL